MSRKQQIIIITPPVIPPPISMSETFTFFGFECPQCNGKGGFNYDDYYRKYKKNLDDPDWQPCEQCNGKGALTAKVAIEWVGEEK